MTFKRITVRYAGQCTSCGGRIERGQTAVYNTTTRTIAHDSESVACARTLQASRAEPDATDLAYEDACAAACGLTNERD